MSAIQMATAPTRSCAGYFTFHIFGTHSVFSLFEPTWDKAIAVLVVEEHILFADLAGVIHVIVTFIVSGVHFIS